jgi:hypothetical protein
MFNKSIIGLLIASILPSRASVQQVATNPAMEPVPPDVQVSWRRSAASPLAQLLQSVSRAQLPVAAGPTAPSQIRAATASQNTPGPDSLLILGSVNNAAALVGQRAGFGNGRNGPPAGGANGLFSTTPETERAMQQALMSRETIPDVSFVAQANYFALSTAEYFVPVNLRIPGAQLAGSENTKRIMLDVIGEVKDEYGTIVQNFRDAVDVPLSEETAKQLPIRQIVFDTGFTVFPGKYSIRFLVHDRNTGRIGTYQVNVDVPNLMKQDKNLPVSSVVLSTELINLDDALPNAMLPRGRSLDSQLAVDPLFIEGKKLIPSLTRSFSRQRELIVLLHAYEPNERPTEPLTAYVTLYHGQTKVFETPPLTLQYYLGRELRILPVKLHVPLSTLAVGSYDCQVTVVDSPAQKSAVWRSQIEVVN